jgi:hypothetical protein
VARRAVYNGPPQGVYMTAIGMEWLNVVPTDSPRNSTNHPILRAPYCR